MNKLTNFFATALFAVSMFISSVSALENNQVKNEQNIDRNAVSECYAEGKSGCR